MYYNKVKGYAIRVIYFYLEINGIRYQWDFY